MARPLFVVAWIGMALGCHSGRHYPDADPVPPVVGRVWSIQYSRHGGIDGVSLDMSMADDGRTRVRLPFPSRTIREGTAAPQRVAEVSTLLVKMISAGELGPKLWCGPFVDRWVTSLANRVRCSGVEDCQTVDLTVTDEGKTYTFGPPGGDLYIELLGSLERTAIEIISPSPSSGT